MNNLSLYEITDEMAQVEKAIYDTLDQETGEVNGDLVEIYKNLQIAQEDKLKGYIDVINKSDDIVELGLKEIDRIKKVIDRHKNLQERLRGTLAQVLEVGKKYDLGLHQIAWRKSEAVEIDNEELLPKEYLKEKITYTPDKTAIKEAIKSGKEVQGAKLVKRNNLQIK